MGQGLDVLQTCNGGVATHDDGLPGNRRGRAGSDNDVNPVHHSQHPNGGGSGGSRRGHGDDPVLRNRELSQNQYQDTVKKAREWQRQIRAENRQLDRDIERIRREEAKLKREIQAMASKGQVQSVNTLAKQVVKSRQSVARLERTKCSMNALQLHLTTAIATASSAGALKMSADMMKEMNAVMNVPELQRTMQEMKMEMGRAEIADEMMEDAFDESDAEDEVDGEVQKVFDELALDTSKLLASTAPNPAHAHLAGGAAYAAPLPLPRAGAAPQSAGRGSDPLMQRLQALQT